MSHDTQGARPWWRQPLLHFLLAAAAIFILDAVRGSPPEQGSRRIVVTVAQVERLAGLWQQTWGRAPSEVQLQSLVRDHIREEIYYREALNLGLDVNDTVIRRRLRQKMEFLSTSDADGTVPEPAQLQVYFERHAQRYQHGPRYDFEQIYFAPANQRQAERALALLAAGSAAQALGEPIGLPASMMGANESTIARTFGSVFFEQLDGLEAGVWAGPLTSGLGLHLVKITNREGSRTPALEEVLANVRNDWMAEQAANAREAAYQLLHAAYEIEIEAPAR